MRALFLILLLVNLALFGWLRGMLGTFPDSGHEPGRLSQQIAADRIRVLTDHDVQQLQRRAADRAAAPHAPAQDESLACLQIGDFVSDDQLEHLRDRLAELKLSERASEVGQDVPGWYRLYLPPAKTLPEAEARVAELRQQGVMEPLILKADGPLHLAILLGSFRDRDLARKQVALFERRGVKGVRISDRPTTQHSTLVQFHDVDSATQRQLQELQKDFPQQKVQACEAPATS